MALTCRLCTPKPAGFSEIPNRSAIAQRFFPLDEEERGKNCASSISFYLKGGFVSMKDAVIAIILNESQDQVLLIKRRDIPIWVLPGGGLESTEDPETAVLREAWEETGLQVGIKRKTGEYTPVNRLASFTHIFECHRIGGTLSTGDETREIAFFPLKALPKMFFFLHAEWLKDALKYSPEIIRKPIANITYSRIVLTFFTNPGLVIRALLARFGIPFNS